MCKDFSLLYTRGSMCKDLDNFFPPALLIQLGVVPCSAISKRLVEVPPLPSPSLPSYRSSDEFLVLTQYHCIYLRLLFVPAPLLPLARLEDELAVSPSRPFVATSEERAETYMRHPQQTFIFLFSVHVFGACFRPDRSMIFQAHLRLEKRVRLFLIFLYLLVLLYCLKVFLSLPAGNMLKSG